LIFLHNNLQIYPNLNFLCEANVNFGLILQILVASCSEALAKVYWILVAGCWLPDTGSAGKRFEAPEQNKTKKTILYSGGFRKTVFLIHKNKTVKNEYT